MVGFISNQFAHVVNLIFTGKWEPYYSGLVTDQGKVNMLLVDLQPVDKSKPFIPSEHFNLI